MKKYFLILPALIILLCSNLALAGYDPNIGVWLSRDPIGEEGGINQYTYVENNPVNLYDPTGEKPQDIPRYIYQIVKLPFKLIKLFEKEAPKKIGPKEAPAPAPKPPVVPPEKPVFSPKTTAEELLAKEAEKLPADVQKRLRDQGFVPINEVPGASFYWPVQGCPGWVKPGPKGGYGVDFY